MTNDARNLLGGYATGSLTEDERRALFEAALHDDALFAALSDEQALKELLDDPAMRAKILRAAETQRFSMAAMLREWLERPRSKALVATGAVLVIAICVSTLRDSPVQVSQKSMPPAVLQQAPLAQAPAPASPVKPQRQARAVPQARSAGSVEEKRQMAADSLSSGQPAGPALLEEPSAPAALTTPAPSVASAPSAPANAQTAAAREVRIRYEVVRRSADGGYQPVPSETVFTAADDVRIRVEANERGVINLVSTAKQTSATLEPGQPAVLALPDPGASSVRLTFHPIASRPVSNTLLPSARAVQMRAKTAAAPAEAGRESDTAAFQQPPALSVEIPIRRK